MQKDLVMQGNIRWIGLRYLETPPMTISVNNKETGSLSIAPMKDYRDVQREKIHPHVAIVIDLRAFASQTTSQLDVLGFCTKY